MQCHLPPARAAHGAHHAPTELRRYLLDSDRFSMGDAGSIPCLSATDDSCPFYEICNGYNLRSYLLRKIFEKRVGKIIKQAAGRGVTRGNLGC